MNDSLPGIDVPPHSLEIAETVWGIDPSSKRVSLAVLDPNPNAVSLLAWQTCSLSQAPNLLVRFDDAYAVQVQMFCEWAELSPPAVVYIEEPFVPRDHRGAPMHLFMFGATLAAIGRAVKCRVEQVQPNVWKSRALGSGHGRADKPEIMRWAQAVGYGGNLQDEADAIGVATAGAVLETAKRPIPA